MNTKLLVVLLFTCVLQCSIADPLGCRDILRTLHPVGETWTNFCHTYQCLASGTRLLKAGCERADGSCFNVGETYQYFCHTFQCVLDRGRAIRRQINTGCTKADGTCYGAGERYNYYCYVYECELVDERQPRRKTVSTACTYYDRCIPVGQIVRHGRREYTCTQLGNGRLIWGRGTQATEARPTCTSKEGKRVLFGNAHIVGCDEYRCTRKAGRYELTLEKTGCLASDGRCRDTGSQGFSCVINGRRQANCRCEENGGGSAALRAGFFTAGGSNTGFEEPSCTTLDGTRVSFGDTLTMGCDVYRCTSRAGRYELVREKSGCQDALGACVDSGSQGFSCVIDGEVKANCRCEVNGDGSAALRPMADSVGGKTGAEDTSCTSTDGTRVSFGATHTIGCDVFRCISSGGRYELIREKSGCQAADGACRDAGARDFACVINGESKANCRCEQNRDGSASLRSLDPTAGDNTRTEDTSCTSTDGTRVSFGATHTIGCDVFRCISSGGRFELIREKSGCQAADGACRDAGARDFACVINGERKANCRCEQNRDGSASLRSLDTTAGDNTRTEDTSCTSTDGTRVSFGATHTVGCDVFRCISSGGKYELTRERSGCQAADGTCRDAGARDFACVINGERRANCRCEQNRDGSASLRSVDTSVGGNTGVDAGSSTRPQGCTGPDGSFIKLDNFYIYNCEEFKCQDENGEYVLKMISKDCVNADGGCERLGADGFPCVIDGVRYNSCKCFLGLDGKPKYLSNTEPTAKGCRQDDGSMAPEGATKTMDCIEYECIRDGDSYVYEQVKENCKGIEGQCWPAESTGFECIIEDRQYASCECRMDENKKANLVAIPEGCTAEDGTFVSLGDSVKVDCTEHQCSREEDILVLKPVSVECKTADGTCVAVGDAGFPCYIDGTRYDKCACAPADDGMLQYTVLEERAAKCIWRNGEEVPVGERRTFDCTVHVCSEHDGKFTMEPVSVECKTAENECLPMGSKDFACFVNGKHHQKCSCSMDGNGQVVYTASPTKCVTNDGKSTDLGGTLTIDCRTYQCTDESGQIELKHINTACITFDKQCVPVGHEDFVCDSNGTPVEHCSCRLQEDRLVYFVNGCTLKDGRYVATGKTINIECVEYVCVKNGEGFGLEVSKRDCITSDKQCLPVGSKGFTCDMNGTPTDNCACELTDDGRPAYYVDGCTLESGRFVPTGESVTLDCVQYMCKRTDTGFKLEHGKKECKTADDECVPVGSADFPCMVNGVRHESCQCREESDGTILYSARANECILPDGVKVKVGDATELNCTTFECTRQGNTLTLRKIDTNCMTANQDCVPLGSADFPCSLRGTYYPACQCEIDDSDGSIVYSLFGCLTQEGTFVHYQETFKHQCREYLCTKSGDKFVFESQFEECYSTDDSCYPVGAEGFPCESQEGTPFENCRCVLGENGKVFMEAVVPASPSPEPVTTEESKPEVQVSGKKTAGGTGEGKNCVFPFIFEGYTYDQCTTYGDDYSRPWCSTTGNYDEDNKKGFCLPDVLPVKTESGETCVFPFVSDGVEYYDCIANTWSGAWCSTTADYDTDGEWDNCEGY